MFEFDINLIQNILDKELGEEAEKFYDIHCQDPYDVKQDFIFPIVSVHTTGIYLAHLLDDKDGDAEIKTERLDYICRVFKSYFFTKVPVRSLFLFKRFRKDRTIKLIEIYDCQNRELCLGSIRIANDIQEYVEKHLQEDAYQPEDACAGLIDKLSTENVSVCNYDSDDADCFIKRGSEWVPAFKKDSDKVFNLAVFGGFFGLHRFYLGRFGSGLLYFLTFGFLGAGWLLDCIEILLGCWKSKGVYLLPVTNKWKQTVKFLVVLAAICFLMYSSMSMFA